MTRYNRAILETAGQYIGVKEIPGIQHNPEILRMFEVSGHGWVQDDETPWCAAFVNMVLAQIGLHHTGSLAARSYDTYGAKVALADIIPGDIVRLWRNSPNSWQGHVAFFVKRDGDRVLLRGGNQGNAVSDQWYPASRIQAVRRADGQIAPVTRPLLRTGAKGSHVTDLQTQLAKLGYFHGASDGIFGQLTTEAVMAFQRENDLTVDGMVGPITWQALETATPRPRSPARAKATAKDLREQGSVIARDAKSLRGVAETGGGLLAVSAVVAQTEEAVSLMGRAQTAVGAVQALLFAYWPVLLIVALAAVVWYYAKRIENARVEDHRTGKHIGR